MENKGTIETILAELAKLFEPIADAAEGGVDGMIEFASKAGLDIGFLFEDTSTAVLTSTATSIKGAYTGIRGLVDEGEIDISDAGEIASILNDIIQTVKGLNSLELREDISEAFQDAGIIIFNYLIITYLQNHAGGLYCLLLLIGIIDNSITEEKLFPTINFSGIVQIFTDFKGHLNNVYKWGDDDFEVIKLFNNLEGLLQSVEISCGMVSVESGDEFPGQVDEGILAASQLRIPIVWIPEGEDDVEFGVSMVAMKEDGSKKPGFGILPYGVVDVEKKFEFEDNWNLTLKASAEALSPYGIILRPGSIEFKSPADLSSSIEASVSALIEKAFSEGSNGMILIGESDGARVELGSVGLKVGFEYSEEPDIFVELPIKGLKVVIVSSDGDGFIQKILPDGVEVNFDLTIGYSNKRGVYFAGSAGLEISIPTHIDLGPISLQALTLSMGIKDDKIQTSLGSNLSASLGPLSLAVENIGFSAPITFPESGGNLGPMNIGFDFKPPNGVGIALDAGVVKGGGYLYFDFDKEEYAGALELTFAEFLSLKAIGLITTRMPDGSKGFSLLIIVTAEFTIQLGYGFVFLGAGGLLGLHRTMKLEALAEGVRTGATANIMFPTNIIENAPQIISDLRTFFPVEEGKFLIGPMAKLGWGTPTLISIALGVVIEIRVDDGGGIERIAILGVLKCILPDEEAALLKLQVNFIGAIDFQNKYAFFFASIFDSRVLTITIEGEMGVLVSWGDSSDFVVSVGGFHPRFNPPPLPFPVPNRVALNIINDCLRKIRVEGYFAVTTNTAQFGAKLEVILGFSEFKIEGHLAFDALFQFSPFYFIVEISGKVALKVFGFDLFSITLKFSLEGTSPWRATGYGKIKILFFTFKARFDISWGESVNTALPPISVIPILTDELNNVQNWTAIVPKNNNLGVTLRELPEPAEGEVGTLALHPLGSLRVSQRALPLRITFDKYGNQKPDDASKLDIEATGDFETVGTIKESFARGQFQEMSDSEKLSCPAYEKEVGGLELSVAGEQTRFGKAVVRHVRYELITIDTAYRRFKLRFFSWMQVLFVHFFANSAVKRASVSFKAKKEYQPFEDKIEVRAGAYTVANVKDNKPYMPDSINFESHASAQEYISTLVAGQPNMANSIHTIPNNEVNTAV